MSFLPVLSLLFPFLPSFFLLLPFSFAFSFLYFSHSLSSLFLPLLCVRYFLPSGQHSSFILGRSRVLISTRMPVIMTVVVHNFSQSLKAKPGIIPHIRPRPPPSISLPIHYSLLIVSSDATMPQLRTSSLNKQEIKNKILNFLWYFWFQYRTNVVCLFTVIPHSIFWDTAVLRFPFCLIFRAHYQYGLLLIIHYTNTEHIKYTTEYLNCVQAYSTRLVKLRQSFYTKTDTRALADFRQVSFYCRYLLPLQNKAQCRFYAFIYQFIHHKSEIISL